jgi:hypothetical protein
MTEDLENVIQEIEPVANANEPEVVEEPKRIFNSDQVKKVVEREKAKAFERGKKEALMELQQQQAPQIPAEQQAQQAQTPIFNGQSQGIGGMQQMSQADIERMIAEKAPQALQQHVQKLQQDQMVNTFVQKMQAAEQQYPGLEAELNNLNFSDPRMHTFIAMANQMENTGDIMKEVLDNPSKMESLLNMAHNQPYQAQKALKSLSDSIRTNQSAKAEEAQARDPMSQIKSSTTSGTKEGSQHDMSVQDIRKLLAKRR